MVGPKPTARTLYRRVQGAGGRGLNPPRRPRSYPRVVKRARHNSYRVKRPGDVGTRHVEPATIDLVNLKPLIWPESQPSAKRSKLQLTA
jgi:hypothetical protein